MSENHIFSVARPDGTRTDIGRDLPLVLFAGPCVIEDEKTVMRIAKDLADTTSKLGIELVFKASYEKDNRGSASGYSGPGLEQGLATLEKVKKEFGLPVISDIHRITDLPLASETLDILQIPAYLCQQTSLVVAAGETGKPINVKKGQFLAPENMASAVGKIRSTGNMNILLTDRGTCLGYNRLVADMRSIPIMQGLGHPAMIDSTHMLRIYGVSSADPKGGESQFIETLTFAGVAAGADALFIETHFDCPAAKCDAVSMLPFERLEPMLEKALKIAQAIGRKTN